MILFSSSVDPIPMQGDGNGLRMCTGVIARACACNHDHLQRTCGRAAAKGPERHTTGRGAATPRTAAARDARQRWLACNAHICLGLPWIGGRIDELIWSLNFAVAKMRLKPEESLVAALISWTMFLSWRPTRIRSLLVNTPRVDEWRIVSSSRTL